MIPHVLPLPGARAREDARSTGPRWPDDEAFRVLYAATARPLWAFLRASCGNRSLADDLLQESYLRLLGAELADDSESGRRAYLYRIASNLLRDHWRGGRRTPPPGPLDDALPAPADPADAAFGERLDVQRALQRLPPRDRELLWLAHAEGLSHREVARHLGLATASVRVLLFRARRRLAALLEPGAGAAR